MAKFLRSRQEIANAINIKRLPTFVFDVTKPYEDYQGYYKTEECLNLMLPSGRFGTLPFEGDLYIEIPRERENKEVTLDDMINHVNIGKSGCTCLSGSFTQRDVLEMAKRRALQEVTLGDVVIVVFIKGNETYVEAMKIPERADGFCTTMCKLLPIKE